MGVKRPKTKNLMQKVARHLEDGTFLDTNHAFDRQTQRRITRPEMLYVLRHGYHDKHKDFFSDAYQEWNYAIRGKTMDKRNLRVVVSFDTSGMLIITAIDLDVS